MSNGDLRLHFVFSERFDMRTFNVNRLDADGVSEVTLYKVFHPLPDSLVSETIFERMNFATGQWDKAGIIEWSNRTTCGVFFGGIPPKIGMRELRKKKKNNSKSRRFKAGGTEYKWKLQPEDTGDTGLVCEGSRGKVVATWTHETNILYVSERVVDQLDHIVITCLMNLWMWTMRLW
ncbi:hypothetical protein QCA50_000325 [Cerrena zonata]|uniref:DUF6593 domain-containing protein n=1 Tax=Cerrena zonata TaxID=2478898 RepID=A0AAW0GWE2_9APHY